MEFDEIVVKESPGLCRCCLSEGCYKDLGTEYSWMDDTEIYADMLLECFDISISQHNDGPNGPNRLICEVCITRLRDACNFKKQVLASEKKFVDMIGRGAFKPKVVVYQNPVKAEVSVEPLQRNEDAEVEYLEEEIDFADDEVIKDSDTEQLTVSEDITVATLPVKGKRGRPRKNAVVKTTKKVKLAKTDDKPKTSKGVTKDFKRGAVIPSANKKRRGNLLTLFNNTTLIPFKWRGKYMCFYCGDDFADCNVLRKHTRSHGAVTETDRAIRLVKSGDSEVKIDVSDIACELCEETFISFDLIVDHLTVKHKLNYDREVHLDITAYRLADLKCLHCDEKFDYFNKLIIHNNNCHPLRCFICEQCKQKFNKKRDLDAHVRAQHRTIYRCLKCSLKFRNNVDFQNHKMNAHTSSCNICFRSFSSASERLKHMKIDHDLGGLQCGYCFKVMTTKQSFLRHASFCTQCVDCVNTSSLLDTVDERKLTVKRIKSGFACILNMSTAIPFKYYLSRFRCFFCREDFTDCDVLKQHTVAKHSSCDVKLNSLKLRNRDEGRIKIDVSTLSCKVCYEPMSDLHYLLNHLTNEHKANVDKSLEFYLQAFKLIKDKFACPICGEVYRYFTMLLKHISLSHTDNENICSYCGKCFRSHPNLRAHVSRRHRHAAISCSHCNMEFNTNNHLQIHLGKVVQCPECNERFTSRHHMQRHMIYVHSSGHKCTHCGKLFTRNSFMINHIRRTHLKERNIQCTLCSERFFDAQRLKMHMVKHYGERNFHCDLCGKKFLWKKNLSGHMTSHMKNILAKREPATNLIKKLNKK